MSGELQGRVAVVTGAANGIGRACAEALASGGARLVLVDRDEVATAHLAGLMAGSRFVAGDVRQPDLPGQVATLCREEFGRCDILVNSAGIQRYGSVVDTSEAIWDEVMDINLKAAYRFCQALIPIMLDGTSGSIINVASVQAFATQAGVAAYTASKGGLVALTRSIALDFAPKVRANAVCPGSVDTPMLRWAAQQFAESEEQALQDWGKMHPMGRIAQPQEVAQMVLFLASDRSSFVTGGAHLVDGGLLTRIPGTD